MSIRNQILSLFILLTLFSVSTGYIWIKDELRPRYLEAQEEVLIDISNILASLISEQSMTSTTTTSAVNSHNTFISSFSGNKPTTKTITTDKFELNPSVLQNAFALLSHQQIMATINQLEKTQIDMRVYVTNQQGVVVFDSDNGRDTGSDYSAWNDVKRTLNGKYGARLSEDAYFYPEGKTMYVAAPIIVKGDIVGVLSVGKPTKNAERFITYLKEHLLFGVIALCALTILVGVLVTFMITRPLKELALYANNISRGKKTPPPKFGRNEIGAVGTALENMKQTLDGKAYVSEYVQNLTHEIKAPVAGIQGAAELLQEDMSATHRTKFLNNILSQASRIHGLVNQLLDLAKIEVMSSLTDTKEINITRLVTDVVSRESDLALSHHVTLHVHASAEPIVMGDQFLLGQALTNIIKNAIEFSPAQSDVIITVTSHHKECIVTVADQGKGIPDYALARITEKFYSMPKPDGKKGSGLGLSFVKEIVDLHQGSLSFKSNEPTGTLVEIKLHLQ